MPYQNFKGLHTGNTVRKFTTSPNHLVSSDYNLNFMVFKRKHAKVPQDLNIENLEFKEGIEYSCNKHKLWELKDKAIKDGCGKASWSKDKFVKVYDFKAISSATHGNCASVHHFNNIGEESQIESYFPHSTFLNANSVECSITKSKFPKKSPKKVSPAHIKRGQQRMPAICKRRNNHISRCDFARANWARWESNNEEEERIATLTAEIVRQDHSVEKLELNFVTPASRRSQLPYHLLEKDIQAEARNEEFKNNRQCRLVQRQFGQNLSADVREYFDEHVQNLEDYFDAEEIDFFANDAYIEDYESPQTNFLLNDFITTNEIRQRLLSQSQIKRQKKRSTSIKASDFSISNMVYDVPSENDTNNVAEIPSSDLDLTVAKDVSVSPNVNLFLDSGLVLSALRVKLSVVSFKELASIYGDRYLEGKSSPVRIAIDVSLDISASTSSAAYIIFQINSYLTDIGSYECSVSFNTSWNKITNLSDFSSIDSDCVYSASAFIELLVEHIRSGLVHKKDTPNVGFSQVIEEIQEKDGVVLSNLTRCRRQLFASISVIESTETVNKVNEIKSSQGDDILNSLENELVKKVDMISCQICFEDCNEASATQLVNCRHSFCVNCWKDHIVSAIKMGKLSLQCPYHGCTEIVDAVTVLSFVSLSLYNTYKNLVITSRVGRSRFYNWCPNIRCGAVLVLKPHLRDVVALNLPINIHCACGAFSCFLCLQEAHWPAPCDVAKMYLKKMVDLGDDIVDLIETKELDVEGKPCPSCRKFIEKMGGCDHISCACGFQFCWRCLNESSKHSSQYACNGSNEFAATDNVTLQIRGTLADFNRSRVYCECLKRRYLRNKFAIGSLSKTLLAPLIAYSEQQKSNNNSASLHDDVQSADEFQRLNEIKLDEMRSEVDAILFKYKELISVSEYSLVYYMHIRKSHKLKASLLLRFHSLLSFTSYRIKEHFDLLAHEKNSCTYHKLHPSMVALRKFFRMSDMIIHNFSQLLKV